MTANMAKRRRRPAKFSLIKAVKANAREKVGQPKPGYAIEDAIGRDRRKQKHKETLGKLLSEE
jgi:hypothetical protein